MVNPIEREQQKDELIKRIGIEAFIQISKPNNFEEWLEYREVLIKHGIQLEHDIKCITEELHYMPSFKDSGVFNETQEAKQLNIKWERGKCTE